MIKIKREGYYVYTHKRLIDRAVVYVGKGCGLRAFDTESRTNEWNAGVDEEYYIDIVDSGMDEQDALDLEDLLIGAIGREDLGLGTLKNKLGGDDLEDNPYRANILKAIKHFEGIVHTFKFSHIAEYIRVPKTEVGNYIVGDLKGLVIEANARVEKAKARIIIDKSIHDIEPMPTLDDLVKAIKPYQVSRMEEVLKEYD